MPLLRSFITTPCSRVPVQRAATGERMRWHSVGLAGVEHLFGVVAGGLGDFQATEHARRFIDAAAPIQGDDMAAGNAAGAILADLNVLVAQRRDLRSEEHTSELQSLMRITYAVFCLK